MHRGIFAGAVIALLLCPSFARAEWTFAGYLGSASTRANTLTLHQPDLGTLVELHAVTYDARSLEPPLYYGYRIGTFWGKHVGIEAEFIHLKVYARTDQAVALQGVIGGAPVPASAPMDAVVQRFSISHGLNVALGNLVWRRRAGARAVLVARTGAGAAIPHGESTIGGQSREQYEISSLALQAGAGFEWRVLGPLWVLGEYKLTTTAPAVAVPHGTMTGRYTSHHLVGGLTIRTSRP